MSLLGAVTQNRLPSLGETTDLLEEALSHRSELAAIELDEARSHAQTSALLLGLAGLFSTLGGVALTLTFAGLVWDSPHRVAWLVGLCVAYLGGAAGAALVLRQRLSDWRPFAETRTQLQRDHQCLTRLIKSLIP